MSRPLFRPEALQQLTRPAASDTPLILPTARDRWLIAAALLLVMGVVLWLNLTTVPRYSEAYGRLFSEEAVLYVRDNDGFTVGMTVHLLPRNTLARENGYLIGTVRTILPTQIYITLQRDDLGYRWTLPSDAAITEGQPVTGRILTGEQSLWDSLNAAR
jgi:hypothetical protein